ncbi:MAG: hypothetical protein JW862_11925 [Anaerolineales bacterium]|nr:hypothetical protein [Anaerolineales bacterium]
MVPQEKTITTENPIELLDNTLEQLWLQVCQAYDLQLEQPPTRVLFSGAAINTPPQAAEVVLVNMLTEVIENIGRFSPWYKLPARAFGLVSIRQPQSSGTRWLLAPEALQRWSASLQQLAQAIRINGGLIQATLVVENLSAEDLLSDPQVSAQCECHPPRYIRISQSVLEKTAIICQECQQPFRE